MAELVTKSEFELQALLGKQLSQSEGFGPSDLKFFARLGMAWLQKHRSQLRDKVCGAVEETGDTMTDAAAVAAAIGSLEALNALHESSAYLVIALLITKQGIKKYCHAYQE